MEMRLTCKRKGGEEDEGGCWQAGLPRLPRDACKEGQGYSLAERRGKRECVSKITENKKLQGSEKFPFSIGWMSGWG